MLSERIKERNKRRIGNALKFSAVLIPAVFFGNSMVKSNQLERQLTPLREEFEEIVTQGEVENPRLKEIVKERDAYSSSLGKGVYGGSWRAVPYDRGYVTRKQPVSVVNPFVRIIPYEEWKAKKGIEKSVDNYISKNKEI